jgi:hypothetical protein
MSWPERRRAAAALLAAGLLGGCSVFSPAPAWELLKAGSGAAGAALAYVPGGAGASQTVHHGAAVPEQVCIEFNRTVQAVDLLPALQAELREHRVGSRVYESGVNMPDCSVWLRYVASIEWGTPPMGSNYRPYLSAAALSLHGADGRLLATSAYLPEESWTAPLALGRWSPTRSKLAPVVKALLTGFHS